MNHKSNELYEPYEPADLLFYVQGKGMRFKDSSLVAFDEITTKILAYGTEARKLRKQGGEHARVISPLRQGRIADYSAAVELFTYFIKKALGKMPLRRPTVAVCMPKAKYLTVVEKKALEDCIIQSGARELMISDLSVESFLKEIRDKFPDMNKKIKVVIEITKEEPEAYVSEMLKEILEYAAEEGIASSRIEEMFRKELDKITGK